MLSSRLRGAAVPSAYLAAAYAPIVRGALLTGGLYYALIAVSHVLMLRGGQLFALLPLASVASVVLMLSWRFLRRSPRPAMRQLELITFAAFCLVLGNVVVHQILAFDEQRLVYFSYMALIFATAAPSRRVAYATVGGAMAGLTFTGWPLGPRFIETYAFVGLAAGFVALGISSLMLGAVVRQIEARLTSERMSVEAVAANRAKSAFLATMSHEIRTPLNGVLGMVQVLEKAGLDPVQNGHLGVIRQSAGALLQILNDILDVSKIEAGKLDLNPEPFALEPFADGLRRLYEALAKERGLRFRLDIEDSADGLCVADEARLRQILANLLSNALKFTRAGEVAVTLQVGTEVLACTVRDTGIGIPADEQATIFDKFTQVDDTATRNFGGTGLGLAICRDLIVLMGGEITVTSIQGQGSTFAFHIPVTRAVEPASPEVRAPAAAGLDRPARLLVVDDKPANQLVLRIMLEQLGCQCGFAADGLEAVEAWAAEPWDAVLMDIHMPGGDGVEATREIRAREQAEGRPRTPILAVTASVMAHEAETYRAAGFDDVVPKPVELPVLIARLDALLAAEAVAPAARQA
jgi:signal transduction histidine kinase/CheY-like chemotaxis protein